MGLHPSTFEPLKPTDDTAATMNTVRVLFKDFVGHLDRLLPNSADKTFVMRTVRTAAMWANVSLTRFDDGTPRES